MDEDEDENWRGKLYFMRNLIKQKFSSMIEEVQVIVKDMETKVDSEIKNVNKRQNKIDSRLDDLQKQ